MLVKNKGIIKQYNIVIYPVDFVVVIGDVEKEVNELYIPWEEHFNHIGVPKSTGATYRVKEKATGTPCILVWMRKVEDFVTSIVSHECCHAALEIFNYIGAAVSYSDQEPFCYLQGNLVRLAVGTFYELPGITPPSIKNDAFHKEPKKKTTKPKKK